jgi:hypothetical protein
MKFVNRAIRIITDNGTPSTHNAKPLTITTSMTLVLEETSVASI